MKIEKALSRMDRLDWLVSRLRVDEPIILRDVAEELNISLATLNRDIRVLKERGVPIESDRGRGGGVRVAAQWGVGRITLGFQEAVDLLIGLAITDKMDLPIMFGNPRGIRTKVIASFSRADQARIKKLADRIKVGQGSSAQVMASFRSQNPIEFDALKSSFLLMRQIEIGYRKDDGSVTERVIEPQYLLLNHPVWYIFAWDHYRGDKRTFRIDRVVRARETVDGFDLRDWDSFAGAAAGGGFAAI